jgi:glyoxylase-like metal-dependent hydrolase (beta-lactamase superfamily II)
VELAPGVHALGGKKGGHVRAFLFDAGAELTLIDTLFEDHARAILDEIRRLGRRPGDLKHVVLTHAHRSHLGGVAELKRVTGATVHAHEDEAEIVAGRRRAQRVTLRPMQTLRLWPFQLGLALGRPKHRPCEVDHALVDGDRVGPLDVLHAPGHSPGHLAFWWPERGFLATGDAVATWPEFGAGWKAFNLDPPRHAASLRRLADLDARILGVGHGDPVTDDAASRLRSLVPR